MSMAFSTAGVALIFLLFITLVPIALLVVLQVWLCRKGKWLGLIFPLLSLLMSLMLVLSISTFSRAGNSVVVYDEQGNIVEEHHEAHHEALTPGAMASIAGVFLVGNIPTIIFGGIWLHQKNRRDFREDLEKMKIEDLE